MNVVLLIHFRRFDPGLKKITVLYCTSKLAIIYYSNNSKLMCMHYNDKYKLLTELQNRLKSQVIHILYSHYLFSSIEHKGLERHMVLLDMSKIPAHSESRIQVDTEPMGEDMESEGIQVPV